MKNDLDKFEKDLLRSLNFSHKTNYTYKNFMEWSNNKSHIKEKLQEGEILYEQDGFYIAIKQNI